MWWWWNILTQKLFYFHFVFFLFRSIDIPTWSLGYSHTWPVCTVAHVLFSHDVLGLSSPAMSQSYPGKNDREIGTHWTGIRSLSLHGNHPQGYVWHLSELPVHFSHVGYGCPLWHGPHSEAIPMKYSCALSTQAMWSLLWNRVLSKLHMVPQVDLVPLPRGRGCLHQTHVWIRIWVLHLHNPVDG